MRSQTLRTAFRLSVSCAAMLIMTGCSTVYFHNADNSTDMEDSQFHNIFLSTIETSKPVDLEAECAGNDWETVMTERTFLNGLIGQLTSGIYTPWSAAWKCRF